VAFADFANLLKASIGLDAASIGGSAVERAVLERVSACGLAGPDAYWQRLCASPVELQQLIEAVVVPETWFFRDRQAFSTLVRVGRKAWWPTPADGVRRILSMPSSTGEEPYSIAMALFDAGVAADRFCIDAVDISAHALAVARAGEYGKNSFRGRELGFRARYFDATATGHRLADRVRRQVQFRQGNLLAGDVAAAPTRYDAIFCRNLLIYFDRPTQERAVRALERLLTPDGIVLVAPCETGVLQNHGFVPLDAPHAFAFRREGAVPAARKPGRRANSVRPFRFRVGSPPAGGPVARTAAAPPIPAAALAANTAAPAEVLVNLDEAAELANRGRFEEAIERCEQHLTRSGPSAEVFHLMALVRDASGNPTEAERCYRKALYLDPHHDEVLAHLTLLLEKAGRTSEAQLLRERTHRLQQGSRLKHAPTL
jgi:chemotaxis protein methyltransferase WspC